MSITRQQMNKDEKRCCLNCKNFVPYEAVIDGSLRKRCGCEYYDMTSERSEIDEKKCNCTDGEGWEQAL